MFPLIEIEGTVERITYYNQENYFTVLRLSTRGKGDVVTAIGHFPFLEVGEVLKVRGSWMIHREYGRQLKVEDYETVMPSSAKEIENYLASEIIRGIGPVTAKRIVARFGDRALEVLTQNPRELLQIEGIGEKRLQGILESFEEQQETREIMIFLQQFGIGPGVAARVYKNYKEKSIEVLKENPYRLADEVYGIGFKTADKIARSMGLEADALERLTSGLKYVVSQAANLGHVYLPKEELLKRASQLLEVEVAQLLQPLMALIEKEELVLETSFGSEDVYLIPFFVCEVAVARRLMLLSALAVKELPLLPEDIEAIEARNGGKDGEKAKRGSQKGRHQRSIGGYRGARHRKDYHRQKLSGLFPKAKAHGGLSCAYRKGRQEND